MLRRVDTRRDDALGMSYLAAGPEDGPLALCLHGFPDLPRGMAPLMTRLADRGHRVLAPWMPGYAPSRTTGRFDLPSVALDLWALMRGRGRFAVIGHDWGAAVAWQMMIERPDRITRGVMMSVPHPTHFSKRLAGSRRQLRRSWYMAYFQLRRSEKALVGGDLLERLWSRWSPGPLPRQHVDAVRACLAESLPAPLAYYRAMPRQLLQLAEPPRRVAVPTLYLHGALDGCIGPEIPDGQESLFEGGFESETVDGAGHFLVLDAPDEVADHVARWLR